MDLQKGGFTISFFGIFELGFGIYFLVRAAIGRGPMFDTRRIKKGQEQRYVQTVRVMLVTLGALACVAGILDFDFIKQLNSPVISLVSLIISLLLVGGIVIFLVLANMMVDKKKVATRAYQKNQSREVFPSSAFDFEDAKKKK